MLDLKTYDTTTLAELAKKLHACADALGGLNRLLGLVETVKAAEKPLLQNKTSSFHYPHGVVRWNKLLFADKVETAAQIARHIERRDNALAIASKKEKNALRALFPVEITIEPDEGAPFSFRAVEAPSTEEARLGLCFELLFFASPGIVKKLYKSYAPEA